MPVRTAEILFVKCVKDGIPNRDPLRDSDARRIFGEEDGRISLSDVSIKRDVRDYVLARFPEDSEQPDLTRLVFVQKKFGGDGKTLLGRDGLANAILEKVRAAHTAAEGEAPAPAKPKKKGKAADADADSDRYLLLGAAFDMRVFGAVFSVTGKSFNQTGPVQFGWRTRSIRWRLAIRRAPSSCRPKTPRTEEYRPRRRIRARPRGPSGRNISFRSRSSPCRASSTPRSRARPA